MIPRLVYGNPQAASEWEQHCRRYRTRHQRRRFWRKVRRWSLRAAVLAAILASGISLHECTPAAAAQASTPQSIPHKGLSL